MKAMPAGITREQLAVFFDRLDGPEGCDFRQDAEGKVTWRCKGGYDKSLALAILQQMEVSRATIERLFEAFESTGGHCDCEILFNSRGYWED